MPSIITPNMGLVIPTPEQEPGPLYAQEINNDLSTLDQHDHTPGYGVPITPLGININSDLTFNSHNATNVLGLQMSPGLAVSGLLGTLSIAGVDLYYTDVNGNEIRLTQGGSIVGASGSITNLLPPATVVFNSGTGVYTFQSNTGIAGGLDAATITIRKTTASSVGISIAAPAALSSNYTLTLPASASVGMLNMDGSGNITSANPASTYVAYNTTTKILSLVYNNIGDQFVFNSSGSLLMKGSDLILANAANSQNVVLTGDQVTTASSGKSLLRIDGSGVQFQSSASPAGVSLYSDLPTTDNAIFFQSNTSSSVAYPLLVSTGYASAGSTRIVVGSFNIQTSSSGSNLRSGYSFTTTSSSTGTVTFSPAFASGVVPVIVGMCSGVSGGEGIAITSVSNTGFSVQTANANRPVQFIALGIF